MAKKVRRVKKGKNKSAADRRSEPSASETAEADPGIEQSLSPAEQFRFDYAYVVKDLRRVLILAGAMFALLIILNLILQ